MVDGHPGGVELATGYLNLVVSSRGVGAAINDAMGRASRNSDKHGEESGKRYSQGFNRGSRLLDITKFVALGAIIRGLASKGMPDFTLGVGKAANIITALTGAVTAAASVIGPATLLVGGLGSAFATAGIGVGAFTALVKPAFSEVFTTLGTLTKSTDAYNAAVAAGDNKAAKKALQDRAIALKALTPAQRTATLATESLVKAFKAQSRSFATPALHAYTQGIHTLQGLIPSLVKIAKPASDAILALFQRANTAAKGKGMHQFVDFLAKNVGPMITKIANLVINLGATVKNVFVAMAPGVFAVLDIFTKLTGQLRKASGGNGLKDFFYQAWQQVDKLGQVIKNAVGLVGDLIKAAMPLAGPVLTAVNMLLKAFRRLFQSKDFAVFVSNIGKILTSVTPLFNVLASALGRVFRVLSGQLLALMPILVPAISNLAGVFADVLIGVSPLLPPLIKLAAALLQGVLPPIYLIIVAARKSLVPVVNLLTAVVKAITPYIVKFSNSLTHSGGVLGWLGNIFNQKIMPATRGVRAAFVGLWHVLGPILMQVYRAIKQAFIDHLPEIRGAMGTMKKIIFTAIDGIRIRVQLVTKLISFIWRNHGSQITSIIRATFGTVISIIGKALKIVLAVMKLTNDLLTGNWKGAWKDIKSILRNAFGIITDIFKLNLKILWTIWRGTILSVWHWIRDRFNDVKDVFRGILNFIKGFFRHGWEDTTAIITTPINKAKSALDKVLGNIKTAFRNAVAAVKKIWSGIQGAVKAPVRFIVNTVIDQVLIGGFNKIAQFAFGNNSHNLKPFRLPSGFAPGGILEGHTPFHRGDDRLVPMRGGEGVTVTEALDDPYERKRLLALNKAALRGVSPAQFRQAFGEGFARGGLVSWKGGTFTPQFAQLLQNAQRQAHVTFNVFQGGFRPATSYSGTSHAGDAVDLGPVTASVVHVLRSLGVAAWRRGPAQGFSLRHIHGVPLPGYGRAGGSGVWQAQDYLKGGDGLGGKDYEARTGVGSGIGKAFTNWVKEVGGSIGGTAKKLFSKITDPIGTIKSLLNSSLARLGSSGFAGVVKAIPGRVLGWLGKKLTGFLSRGTGIGTAGSGVNGSAQTIARGLLHGYGWGPDQWPPLKQLWTGENSRWDVHARNPQSGAYGIPQALPGSKMAVAGADWRDSADTQIRWGLGYIRGSYGTPANALSKWLSRNPHWYAGGGILPKSIKGWDPDPLGRMLAAQTGILTKKFDTGGYLEPKSITMAVNGTNRRERVGFDETAPLVGNLTLVSRNESVKEDLEEVGYQLRAMNRRGVY